LNNIRTTTQEETHYKVMSLLEENPGLTQIGLGVDYCPQRYVRAYLHENTYHEK
jgi:hypothetical protein